MAQRRPAPGDETPRHIVRAMEAMERRGGRLTREVIAAYQRARMELLGRLLAGQDSRLTDTHYRMILVQVEDRLRTLYGEVRQRFGDAIAESLRIESEQAVREMRRLPLFDAADRALFEQSGILAPRIPHRMVDLLVENAGARIKALDDRILAGVRTTLMQTMIRGESIHTAAKAILGEGLTLEGAQPVFPTVWARAETIARTEIAEAANQAHLDTYIRAADQFPDLMNEWNSCLCAGRTCGLCRKLHGQRRRPGENFSASIGSRSFTGPRPTAHPKCLCRLVAVIRP